MMITARIDFELEPFGLRALAWRRVFDRSVVGGEVRAVALSFRLSFRHWRELW